MSDHAPLSDAGAVLCHRPVRGGRRHRVVTFGIQREVARVCDGRAVLDLGLCHHRIETGPGIDVAANERGFAVGMLQQNRRDVLLGQLHALQRADEKDVRIGAARHRDALAFQVLDLRDQGVLAGDERGPLRAREHIDRLDRIAVDLGDQRRRTRGRAEVDR